MFEGGKNMNDHTNVEIHSASVHVPINPEGSTKLEDILAEMSDEKNLGDDFSKRDYFYLVLVGLVIPFILMIWGWFL